MAQEHGAAQPKAAWIKIFSAFKIALDMKKMLLAAAGILATFLGWWVLGAAFYGMRTFPEWSLEAPDDKADAEQKDRKWKQFLAKRASWNLLHELAGTAADLKFVDAADVTEDREEFLLLDKWARGYRANERLGDAIVISAVKGKEATLEHVKSKLSVKLTALDKSAEEKLTSLEQTKLTVRSITLKQLQEGDKVSNGIIIDKANFSVDGAYDKLKELRQGAVDMDEIERAADADGRPISKKALQTFREYLVYPKTKPYGKLRVWPGHEERGENPYLLVANAVKTRGESIVGGGKFLSWFFGSEAPVLLEPLYKFFAPIVYFFDSRAGFFDRLYLILVMAWTVVVWGFFGGAICRIAAVQVARNERITLKDAIAFTRERCVSFIAAPVFPLILIGFFTLALMLFGWIEWIPIVGDLFAGVLWPIVLLLGFIMAIVLVGLVGWPMMTATISTEGTDSFDALSRSYSYVFQAPWQYLWYNFLAIVYGAALVFFIGFMASLVLFLGKWGVSSAVGLAKADEQSDREPSYLFNYAPTSFGWRDLMIGSSPFTRVETVITNDGQPVLRREFTSKYQDHLSFFNKMGAALVALWVYLFFFLVVGFGYSYFWSASTIIYFLMRRYVDDTEMDEVHQEDEDMEDPFLKPAPTAPAPAPPPSGKPGTLSLNVVEAPPPPPPPFTPPTSIAPNESPIPPSPPVLPEPPPGSPPPEGNV